MIPAQRPIAVPRAMALALTLLVQCTFLTDGRTDGHCSRTNRRYAFGVSPKKRSRLRIIMRWRRADSLDANLPFQCVAN